MRNCGKQTREDYYILQMKQTPCQKHPQLPVILLCVQPKCGSRLVCLRCSDGHARHDMVSVEYFCGEMLSRVQANRSNPDRAKIIKQLNTAKQQMLHKLQTLRNKINGLLGQCEDKVQHLFSRIYHSCAPEPHAVLVKKLQEELTSKLVDEFIAQIQQTDAVVLGSLAETTAVMYANMEQFRQKVNEASVSCTTAVNGITGLVAGLSVARPQPFRQQFSREKFQRGSFAVSDEGLSVTRCVGNGNYPLCLGATPFSPVSTRACFQIVKALQNKSVSVGVCLQPVVRGNGYLNCGAFGKGVYAIDQSSPYSSGGTMLASWNHHDVQFNQANVGASDLVGWTFKEGDRISMQVDYYNGVVAFYKGGPQVWEEGEDVPVYEMPVKLDAGAIYPYVSMAAKGDTVRMVQFE